MQNCQFAHCSLCIHDLKAAEFFYQNLLGLPKIPRPDLPFPGAWFDLGQNQSLHLLAVLSAPLPESSRPLGQSAHLALYVHDFEDTQQRLTAAGVTIVTSRSGRAAFFCQDPSGNILECLACPQIATK